MAMFSAYFDGAGNALDQPFIVVSGYIANYYQWKVLGDMWASIHREHGVNRPFHMAELMAAHVNPKYKHQKNARADYVSLAGDHKRSGEFFKNICVAQLTIVNCGMCCMVNMDVYNEVSSRSDIRKIVPPYALAARVCMEQVHVWEEQFGVVSPAECIFEEGDFEQGKFTELMVSEGLPVPIYKKKNDYAGLQAADHYAWEHFFHLKQELHKDELLPRGAFKQMLSAIPKMNLEVTAKGLINLCRVKNIDLTGK